MKSLLPIILLPQLSLALTPDEHATLRALPILSSKCAACHGEDPDKIKGDLNLLTREGFLKGGEFIDNLLVPGDPEKSFLMTVIKWEDSDYEMPPKENDRLNEEQIAHIETWIKNGAPWPDEESQKTIRLSAQLLQQQLCPYRALDPLGSCQQQLLSCLREPSLAPVR